MVLIVCLGQIMMTMSANVTWLVNLLKIA